MDWLRSVRGGVAVVAHRGAHAYAPENTMAAYRLARRLGADAIELDVHLSADDRLVIIHDDVLDRTTSGRGLVRERTWDELSRLSAGAWYAPEFASERMPLLEEVLGWAAEAGMPLSLELKRPNPALGRDAYPDLPARVLAMVDRFDMRDRVLLFSDDHASVREVRRLAPDVDTSITLGGAIYLDTIGIARAAGANGIAIYWSYASKDLVETCHAAGLHVFGFGVGDDLSRRLELEAMIANGTDFISGGAPDKLRAILEGAESGLA